MTRTEGVPGWVLFLLVYVVLIAITYACSTIVKAHESRVQNLLGFVSSESSKSYLVDKATDELGNTVAVFSRKINRAAHDYFDWTYDIHVLAVIYSPDDRIYSAECSRREYQECVNGGRACAVYYMADINADNFVDRKAKNFYVVTDEDRVMFPPYPDGFVNTDWYDFPSETAQTEYDKEVAFWCKTATF